MPSDHSPPNNIPAFDLARTLALLSVGTVLAATAGFGAWTAYTGQHTLAGLLKPFTTPQPAAQADVRSVMLTKIRSASELTTTVFGMEAIVPASRDRVFGDWTLGSTKLLYIAYAEVRAGIDLSTLTAADTTLTGNRLEIRLPPPRILDRKIDVERSQVYDYDRGFLSLGPDVAPELMTLAQRQALEKVTQAACDRQILATANERARVAIAQLIQQPAITLQVITQDPQECQAPANSAPTSPLPLPPPAAPSLPQETTP